MECQPDVNTIQHRTINRFPAETVDSARLAIAVQKVLEAYPVFRMRFADHNGEIVQFVDKSLEFEIGTYTAKEEEMPEIRESFMRPFNPFSGPMSRAEVITTEIATYLITDFFHLIYDGTSKQIFVAAVVAAYEGRELPREEKTFAQKSLSMTIELASLSPKSVIASSVAC